jgi:hypothetical protein
VRASGEQQGALLALALDLPRLGIDGVRREASVPLRHPLALDRIAVGDGVLGEILLLDPARGYMWIHIGGPLTINLTMLSILVGGLVLLWGLWKLFQRET